jgi:hypothetical protein
MLPGILSPISYDITSLQSNFQQTKQVEDARKKTWASLIVHNQNEEGCGDNLLTPPNAFGIWVYAVSGVCSASGVNTAPLLEKKAPVKLNDSRSTYVRHALGRPPEANRDAAEERAIGREVEDRHISNVPYHEPGQGRLG